MVKKMRKFGTLKRINKTNLNKVPDKPGYMEYLPKAVNCRN